MSNHTHTWRYGGQVTIGKRVYDILVCDCGERTHEEVSGLVVAVVDGGVRYELTPTGHARLAQLASRSTVPAMRQAA